jgi:hypothetical protein
VRELFAFARSSFEYEMQTRIRGRREKREERKR